MTTIMKTGVFSRPGTMDDAPAVAELANAARLAETGRAGITTAEVAEQWSYEYFQPGRDLHLIFSPAGTLAAACECWSRAPYTEPYFWGAVHPDCRRQGYGSLLLDWAEDRAADNLHLAPPELRVAMRLQADARNEGAAALFTRRGYDIIRHFWVMQIALDPDQRPDVPPLPEGVRLRTHTPGPEQDYAVWEVLETAFADHWGFIPTPYALYRQAMIDAAHFDPSLWFLAVADGPEGERIVGVSLGRMGWSGDSDCGFVMELAVRREYRRQGIALSLLRHTFDAFHRRGMYRVALGVDSQNTTGATRLYERAGMSILERTDLYEKVLRDGLPPAVE